MTLASTAPSALDYRESDGAFRILVVHSPHAGVVGTSRALVGSLYLGRQPSDEQRLCLDDAAVSRSHAVIEPDEPAVRWRVRDLGSRNGTIVDGRKVATSPLEHGSVIRVGAHLILVQHLTAFDLELMLLPPPKSTRLSGESVALMRVRREIALFAPTARPVLILGETGVGKELVAADLHEASDRKGGLVPVNCAALPAHLVESELFGHARGAFTGAQNRSEGLFGQADGGTIFLDEIGEMSLDLQAKLLRALATGEVRAVGETVSRRVDVRVVAATNVDLERAVEAGRFRADLYSRLMGATIRVPPLRERRDDVLPLCRHFLSAASADCDISPDAAEALLTHEWRFNVRELEQVTHAASLHASGGTLELAHLPEPIRERVESRRTSQRPEAPREVPLPLRINRNATPTADDLREVLRHFEGNIANVAAFFGKDRRQVYRWAERLGVDVDSFR